MRWIRITHTHTPIIFQVRHSSAVLSNLPLIQHIVSTRTIYFLYFWQVTCHKIIYGPAIGCHFMSRIIILPIASWRTGNTVPKDCDPAHNSGCSDTKMYLPTFRGYKSCMLWIIVARAKWTKRKWHLRLAYFVKRNKS